MERLKMLRLSQGLSQEDLSEAIGGMVSKQAISKYEQGKDQPRPTVARKLAEVLGVKMAYLLGQAQVIVSPIAYRSKSHLKATEKERLENILSIELERRSLLLLRVFGQQAFTLPQFTVTNTDEVEVAAIELRQYWGLGLQPIPHLVDLLEAQQVQVVMVEADDDFDGLSAWIKDEAGQLIGAGVMSRLEVAGERARMSLAHELGHLLLQVNNSDNALEERLAKHFAGAFLFPAAAVRQELGQLRRSLDQQELLTLKTRYGISMAAIVMRAESLGIIDKNAALSFWKRRSKQGWQKSEPNPLPLETATRFIQNLRRGVAEGILSRAELIAYPEFAELTSISRTTGHFQGQPNAETLAAIEAEYNDPNSEARIWLDAALSSAWEEHD
jgi:Zn-dependent peptidase ImmA (M78 family)/DNA-binding XRE family transcriptional regulator